MIQLPAQSQAQPIRARVIFVILVAYCLIPAAALVGFSATHLNNPWENTYFESPQSYAALHAVQTGKLYIPMSEPPYTPQAYTPLYYATNAATAWFARANLDRFILYSRVITFLAYLFSGLLIYLVCRTVAVPRVYSILAGLMMLGQPDFFGWNVSPRPDMHFLFAMLLSLFCAIKWADRPWLGYGLAGLIGGCAFLIKQPGMAVLAAIFVVLLMQRQFKNAAILTVSAVVPVVAVVVVLFERRDPFLQQLLFVRNSLWSLPDMLKFCAQHLLSFYWLVPAAIGALGFPRAIRAGHQSRMIASFAAMNWFMGFASLPQVGGYTNYLFPGLAGSALLLPYAMEAARAHSRSILAVVAAGAVLTLATYGSYRSTLGVHRYLKPPSTNSLSWLRPYRVLSDLTTMNMHGRDPELLDPFGAHVLELTGHWDAKPLIENLRQSKYDLIIFTRMNLYHVIPSFRGISYLGPVETKALNDNYDPLCSTVASLVLRPRNRQVPLTPEFLSRELGRPCLVSPPGHHITLLMDSEAQ